MEVQGVIKLIEETKTYGSNGFRKRLCVVTTEGEYPQDLPIDFVQDKTEVLDSYNEGDAVKVSVNLRGNEHNGRYYAGIQGWRIEKIEQSAEIPPIPPVDDFEPANDLNEEDLDLPF